MLEAKPLGMFSRDFAIESAGRQVALLDPSWWKEAAAVSIEGEPHRLLREGAFSGPFLLMQGEREVFRAVKPSVLSSHFEFELDSRHYRLQRDSILGRSFSVVLDGAVVGRIRLEGAFTRKTLIELPDGWTTPIQVFLFWLVLLIWERDESAAAAAVS